MGVIAKYKFNNTLEANLLPEFNSEFTSDLYTVTDEVDGEVTTRTIESDSLPTLMRFGAAESSVATERSKSLLEIISLDISNCTQLYHYFKYCINLTTVNGLVVHSDIKNLDNTFGNCNSLESVDTSNWDTSNVTHMSHMFTDCYNLASLDVSNFDTSNVTSMGNMFYCCSNLTTLDVSNWDISNVTNMNGIFNNTNNLKYLKCNNITTLNTLNTYLPTKTSDNQGTIICKSDITNLDTTTLQSKYWNVTSETTLIAKYVFDKSIHNNCIPEFNTDFEGYFIEDEVEGNEVTRVIESCGMLPTLMRFGTSSDSDNRSLSFLKILYINAIELTTMHTMFRRCRNLISVHNVDKVTNKVLNMWAMFADCNNLEYVDVSNWDVTKVSSLNYGFSNCYKLANIDVSKWDTSNITTTYYLFYSCRELTKLDLSNWNTSNILNMGYMFASSTKLQTLDISNFDMTNVTDTIDMFYNTPKLTDIGILYCNASTIQKIINAMPTDSNKTLWYKDVDIDGITHGNNITLKKYMEENVEIVLNSPLLKGDTIEVVDGKLCHYHKMNMIVLDGSEGDISQTSGGKWYRTSVEDGATQFVHYNASRKVGYNTSICDKFLNTGNSDPFTPGKRKAFTYTDHPDLDRMYFNFGTPDTSMQEWWSWLSENPTTVVYELAEPYYEDITPLQSSIALRTFEECNVQIITALPIKTKITYRTNITSAVVMEQELDTLDSGVSLSNLIEEEVDE